MNAKSSETNRKEFVTINKRQNERILINIKTLMIVGVLLISTLGFADTVTSELTE